LEEFPEATYLQILYGNFLISIMKDSAMGMALRENSPRIQIKRVPSAPDGL